MLLDDRASFLTLLIVPSPCSAAARDPPNTGNTGGASVGPTATLLETVVPTGNPLGASPCHTLRPGHDNHARKHTPGAVSAPRTTVVSNTRAYLIALSSFSQIQLNPLKWELSISFIDRVAQISNSLAYHVVNDPPVMKSYCVSGYTSLVHSITAAKSALVLALVDWNMYMDQIAASEGWGNSLPSPVHFPSNVGLIPETGMLPGRQTEMALHQAEGLCAYAARTAQRTTLLLGQIAVRKVERWDVVGKTTVWVARIGRMAWDRLVIVAATLMALLAGLALLGLTWVLIRWWRAARWLWRLIW